MNCIFLKLDRRRVTICVSYPTGMFDQYIAQSGSATSFWAIEDDPVASATRLAPFINCTGSDIPALTTCFQEVDAMELVRAFDQFLVSGNPLSRMFFLFLL